jgi:hypothetical protein
MCPGFVRARLVTGAAARGEREAARARGACAAAHLTPRAGGAQAARLARAEAEAHARARALEREHGARLEALAAAADADRCVSA